MNAETWRAVPRWEGFYEVSDLGRVRSVPREIVCPKHQRPGEFRRWLLSYRLLRQHTIPYGYLSLQLRRPPGRHETTTAHRLVLLAFVGPRPDGMQCRHLNGIPTDNRLTNLCWGTALEQQDDMRRHGTFQRGEHTSNARLTETDVLWLREQRARGHKLSDLAVVLGIDGGHASRLANRLSWRHLP